MDAARYVKDRLTAPIAGEGRETGTAGQRARDGADEVKAHGQGLADRAREGYEDAKHSASQAYEDTKHRVLDTAEEAKQRARDAAERARPRTLEVRVAPAGHSGFMAYTDVASQLARRNQLVHYKLRHGLVRICESRARPDRAPARAGG